jgi:hypothetical protein
MKRNVAVKFETKLFAKKINGIMLGDMTRPAVYPKPWYSEVRYNRVSV